MEQFITFAGNHWLLCLAFLVVLILIIVEESRGVLRGVPRVSPQEAIQLVNREDALIVDIRDAAAYDNGHILNALHLPASVLESDLSRLDKQKEKPVIVVCAAGQTSVKPAAQLHKQGFKVKILAGGLNAWRNAGLPLVKK